MCCVSVVFCIDFICSGFCRGESEDIALCQVEGCVFNVVYVDVDAIVCYRMV